MRPFLPVVLAVVVTIPLSLCAQNLNESFKERRVTWEKRINKGDSGSVRKEIDGFIQREIASANPYDYNAMHSIVGAINLAARACVANGSWEDAIDYLKKAIRIATENFNNAETSLNKLLAIHNKKLKDWTSEVSKQENNMQDLESNDNLSIEQKENRERLQIFLDEHHKAIAQSEQSIKEIKDLLNVLKTEKESYEASLTDWQKFLTKERSEITKFGTVTEYVAEKLKQIKLDATKTDLERLAYEKRLLHLDPSAIKFIALKPYYPDPPQPHTEPSMQPLTVKPRLSQSSNHQKISNKNNVPKATVKRNGKKLSKTNHNA